MSDSSDNEQREIDDFSYAAEEEDQPHTNEKSQSGIASLPEEVIANPDEAFAPDETLSDEQAALNEVFKEYLSEIDGKLIEAGWLYLPNKSTEYGKVDQSMLNHTRNLVFFLHRLATQAEPAGLRPISPKELRHLIALAVIHDYHKLRDEDENRSERFNITIAELEPFIDELSLKEFSTEPSEENSALEMQDFRSCAVDHHATNNAKSTNVTLRWEEYRPFIRLADGMASSTTPEEAANERAQKQFQECFPGAGVELAHHRIDHVSGIFTNLLNAAVDELLEEKYDHTLLTIYQDGCVYLAPQNSCPELTENFVDAVYKRLSDNISDSHPTYSNTDLLAEDIATVNLGHYSLNPSQFFYAGSQRVTQAIIKKGVNDGSIEEGPTDSALESMELLEDDLGRELYKTSQLYGIARFVSTIRRGILPTFLDDSGMKSEEGLRATGYVLNLPEDVAEELISLPPDVKDRLVSGNKWEFSYVFGQALLKKHGQGIKISEAESELIQDIENGLDSLADESNWMEILRENHSGGYRSEVVSFIQKHLRIGNGLQGEAGALTDTFHQYAETSRRGRICSLCSGGLSNRHNLGDMQPSDDVTMIRGGFTNRDPVGSGKRDNRVVCVPCQIELSLRGAASNNRYTGRLFVHLSPDYFYTPFAWRLYNRIINQFTGDNRVRIGRLAEAVFDIEEPEKFNQVLVELTQDDGGRPMIDSLSGGFDQEAQYGAQVVGYFKELYDDDTGNDTEFQFFGAFLALAISSHTGMRVYLSASPIPETQSRDFREFVKIGGGFSQVTAFYGDDVPLSELQGRLRSAAALIKLGHALQGNSRKDSLFAKYLRVTRNELLPGSHLLKRAAQSSDEGPYIPALMRYAVTLDEQAGIKQHGSNMSDTPHSRVTQLADLAYDAIRPASGHGRKPHRVERVFRESVKAVSKTGEQLSRDDYVMLVSGRLQKMLDRQAGDGVYPVSTEMSNAGTSLQERIEKYSEFFVDEILYGIANGRPSQLKRLKNNLADGFFGATLRAETRFYEERDQETETNDADTEME
ncbi:type I-D CRISPR-associated protein Cas10d/Csc3 [Natronolimnobius sp. AArcel1]|uniref:type I-D CRISPR-associated protein Cas10d/Csc3 n=1 Tax=Natronolimnobius sp. AArcel1 TaxID=1679093 RepID=UPI0013EDE9F1|nr:type I-D CRISPR-associated protein Cas10d/Csc3 [Natronolimnobius sp. AArcel1]NGM71594.1 type I-D CRISPR-associated protein Cas10d/Csc3 [Natronolimnobius sp. AArcel1]